MQEREAFMLVSHLGRQPERSEVRAPRSLIVNIIETLIVVFVFLINYPD